ncbi:biotin--protein ligase 2-like [Cornus florida]|uniref:biotin--protein ligase 2-like n=1 Tax=Cornus florida TaxID=4283 RepID=UPI00289E4DC5|nr:biotin--protein ligase 2-like [Cornus florida]
MMNHSHSFHRPMNVVFSEPMPFASFLRFLSLQTSLHFLSLKNSLPLLVLPKLVSADKRLLSLSLSIASSAMDCQSPCRLVLCGKSSTENELAKSLKNNATLKLPDSAEISIILHSETEKPFEKECFRIDSFMNALSTSRFGRFLIWSSRLPSTHDIVSHNFSELPIGAVCVADVQYKGRGRSKNVWESPIGCLLFSFTIQMEDGRVVPLVQYVVSLAMTEAIKDVCDKNGVPHLDVRIKWPNDLYLNGLKVGGILCTSIYRSKKFNVSAGIGLNVDNEKPSSCLNSELQKLTSVAYQLRKEDILAAFFNKFENIFGLFLNEGFQPLEELYYKTWLHSGQRVIVQEMIEDQLVENVVTVQGLTSSGYLLAIGDDGQMCELHPDGNSFDFFKGLVRRKLA